MSSVTGLALTECRRSWTPWREKETKLKEICNNHWRVKVGKRSTMGEFVFFVEIFSFYVYTNAISFHRLMLYSIAAGKGEQTKKKDSSRTHRFVNTAQWGKKCSRTTVDLAKNVRSTFWGCAYPCFRRSRCLVSRWTWTTNEKETIYMIQSTVEVICVWIEWSREQSDRKEKETKKPTREREENFQS